MEIKKGLDNQVGLLHHLGNASKHLIQHHYRDNLSEFMLHDLCSGQGFNLRKAAYLVNNPDFTCLKGVAGYYHPEVFEGTTWSHPKDFTSHMQKSPFNQRVRSYLNSSLSSGQAKDISKKKIYELVDYLEIEDPAYHIWDAKHNNQGIFIFERPLDYAVDHEHLFNFLHMLSFCPVF